MTDSSLARRERQALCDTALALDADAPTLCGDWDVAMLLAHLIVRERKPLKSSGIMIPALAGVTDRAMAKEAARGVPAMVETLRRAPLTWYSLPGVEKYTQTLEYVVHHEDLRRGRPGWEPRELPAADVDELWNLVSRSGAYLGRNLKVATRIACSDEPDTSARFSKGDDPVVVTGPVVELIMWAFGRTELRDVTVDGPPEKVAQLDAANRKV